jgi:hypothetical protein
MPYSEQSYLYNGSNSEAALEAVQVRLRVHLINQSRVGDSGGESTLKALNNLDQMRPLPLEDPPWWLPMAPQPGSSAGTLPW